MTRPVEILVHVSGPSRGADDARYRKEVSGFLEFNAIEKHILFRSEERPKNGHLCRQGSLEAPTERSKRTLSNLLQSSAETDHAPSERHIKNADISQHKTPGPIHYPPPQIITPSVLKPAAPSSEISFVKETPHLLIARTPAPPLPRPRTFPNKTPTSHHPITLRRTQSDSWQTPPSVIPNSQPTPPSSNHNSPEISISPILKRPFVLSSSPSPTRPSDSPVSKRPRLQVPSSPPPEEQTTHKSPAAPTSSHIPSSAPLQPQKRHHKSTPPTLPPSSSPPSSTSKPHPLPLEIHPPRPPTSTAHFKTHLTPSLINLTTQLPLDRWFDAYTKTTTRPLQKLERGHWLMPLSKLKSPSTTTPSHPIPHYPTASKIETPLLEKFWTFLTEYIGGGRAGFGVRCFRENVVNEEGKEEGGGEEVAKIYCWGEVVGEVWLLLFLASDRKVIGAGAKWVDAGGEAVVVMR